MNDLSNLVPIAAGALHLAPSTLLLILAALHIGAKIVSRKIPDDKTGALGTIRDVAGIIGADVPSVLTTSPDGKAVTVTDVAKAAATTSPIPEKVAEEAGAVPVAAEL